MNETYLSITQVNNYIKNIFEAEVMLQNICVFGEVSSYKVSNGIAYFNLQDENGLLPCVLFGANKFEVPNIGDMVLVIGSINYYAKGGKLSFNAYQIAPYGRGMLYENFLKLKADLESRGYFELSRKKPLPARVTRIGIVTSQTGAVIQDIIDVSSRRNKGIQIVLYPVKVQGIGSEIEISKGIDFFSEYSVDVVIVARGGGSMEDLQPFNSLAVAEAVFRCKKPIVSAVGHETDYTIIDFVSDLRAPTPSAAAELVVNKLSDDLLTIDAYLIKLNLNMINKINKLDNKLIQNSKLLNNGISIKLNEINNIIGLNLTKIESKIELIGTTTEHKIAMLSNKLLSLNPILPLAKGFVKVEKDDRIIKSKSEIETDKEYQLVFADGKAKVKGV